ncbi:Rieske 2Fe-2S domain-containing protein [Rubrobacter tropicus]|uniref:Rieske 2Fe-2S domain-containing protein n=1 Tax=Rubrobacter tropicus TaxID=2653851 RepID=A0A6G8Q9X6_9ACTN|nr:Rieske (2Fe-2S) protein [Rubrobacter tropicus]QIN83285.1 Rieske 2Fe-2S domain-containing protein [Rubrobacter tropicus]
MGRHVVGRVGELPPGDRKVVEVEGRSIGLFNVNGRFHALKNSCPHQAAPLCLGSVKGMTMPGKPGEYVWDREGEILRCPWHGWEFDILTGRSVFNPHKTRVRSYEVTVEPPAEFGDEERVETYPVSVEDGLVVVHL